jgi:hypothetical protein
MRAALTTEDAVRERTRRLRSQIDLDGQTIGYDLYELDCRTDGQRSNDRERGSLAGDLIVIIPGHGQTVDTTANLLRGSAAASKAGVAWAIDIDPPQNGDPDKAAALPVIVRQQARHLFSGDGAQGGAPEIRVALFGWSHGGAEALRTAQAAPDLIASITGLCPTGLVERRSAELVTGFVLECARILLAALSKGFSGIWQVLMIGLHIVTGIAGDAIRSRSLRRPLEDAIWATHKVPGPGYAYPHQVALIFAAQDSVIRWHDVFPGCTTPDDLAPCLDGYRQADFPHVSSLDVLVLPGNHASPETDPAYALNALEIIGQSRASRGYY